MSEPVVIPPVRATRPTQRATVANRRAWAAANADFAAGRHRLLDAAHPPIWATATFVRQLAATGDGERLAVLSAACAVSLNPHHPHPVLAARRLMREPLGALTMGGHHQRFLTWRVDPQSGRVVLLTIERAGR